MANIRRRDRPATSDDTELRRALIYVKAGDKPSSSATAANSRPMVRQASPISHAYFPSHWPCGDQGGC